MSDFGLNIVCEAPVTAAPTIKKKQKKSKYDKRREASRKAKGGGEEGNAPAARVVVATQHPLDEPDQSEPEVKQPQQPQHEESVTPSEPLTPSAPAIPSDQQESEQVKKDAAAPLSEVAPSSAATAPISVTPPAATGPVSRKRHAPSLENDDEERAKYMAEFHARPLEMDRKSGASGRYTESQQSQHLFETADKQLPLHPKLLHQCQTQFNMKQATLVQTNTWTQFHANDEKNNLFIQSETGSGKTLAFLMPIVQVRAILVLFCNAKYLCERKNMVKK